jgi:hypothetical protein
VASQLEGKLSVAQQTLSAEMQRLLGQRYQRAKDAPVGGIPVDSEYIIFIVDTSGSMQNYSWRLAEQKLREVLEVYPKVKGIQVLDDEGGYMFGEYRNKWIPDSKERRKVILDRFRNWQAFSNSSPVEGIVAAIRTFWSADRKISLYVFGDEFTGGSVQQVVDQVDRINRSGAQGGDRLVRIHAIGFPLDPAAPLFSLPARACRRPCWGAMRWSANSVKARWVWCIWAKTPRSIALWRLRPWRCHRNLKPTSLMK